MKIKISLSLEAKYFLACFIKFAEESQVENLNINEYVLFKFLRILGNRDLEDLFKLVGYSSELPPTFPLDDTLVRTLTASEINKLNLNSIDKRVLRAIDGYTSRHDPPLNQSVNTLLFVYICYGAVDGLEAAAKILSTKKIPSAELVTIDGLPCIRINQKLKASQMIKWIKDNKKKFEVFCDDGDKELHSSSYNLLRDLRLLLKRHIGKKENRNEQKKIWAISKESKFCNEEVVKKVLQKLEKKLVVKKKADPYIDSLFERES